MKRITNVRQLGLAALLSVAACKSKSAGADYTQSPGSYDAAMMDEDGYGGDDEYVSVTGASAAEPAAAGPAPARDERRRVFGRAKTKTRRSAAGEMAALPPTQPDQAPSADGASAASTQPEKAIEQRDPEVEARHIVYTAELHVSVFNLDDAMEKAESLPETYGGYISTMSQGHLVLRIPSKHLRTVMAELGEYGNIERRSLQAMDVTAEFTDIESRIRALEETQKQLLTLLSKSRNVQEALQVRQALDNITTQLEVLKGRMRQLGNQISFSTLTVTLVERGPHAPIPSSNDPFPWVNDLGVEATEWK